MAARIDDEFMTAEYGGRDRHDGMASMGQMTNAARGSYLAGAAVCLLATRRSRSWSSRNVWPGHDDHYPLVTGWREELSQ